MRTFLLLLFCAPFYGHGQNSHFEKVHTDSISRLYLAQFSGNLPIHNGRLYLGYYNIDGSAFYPSNNWYKADLLFKNIWYPDVNIMYDTYMDDVILLNPEKTPIRLYSGHVQQFQFDSLKFVRLYPDEGKVLTEGIYQVLEEGKATVFVRRKKIIEEQIQNLTIERKFITATRYYIFKDGKYYAITNKNSLLGLFSNIRPELTKLLKSRGIKFRKDPEGAVETVVKYYNDQAN